MSKMIVVVDVPGDGTINLNSFQEVLSWQGATVTPLCIDADAISLAATHAHTAAREYSLSALSGKHGPKTTILARELRKHADKMRSASCVLDGRELIPRIGCYCGDVLNDSGNCLRCDLGGQVVALQGNSTDAEEKLDAPR